MTPAAESVATAESVADSADDGVAVAAQQRTEAGALAGVQAAGPSGNTAVTAEATADFVSRRD